MYTNLRDITLARMIHEALWRDYKDDRTTGGTIADCVFYLLILGRSRKFDTECRCLARFGIDGDDPTVAFYNLVRYGKTQSSAGGFGRKERVEYLFL